MFDAIIVGSGAAGVFAAYQLRHRKVLLIDVGHVASEETLPKESIYSLYRENVDLFSGIIGNEFQALHNLDRPYMSPKLKGPLMRFITQKPKVFFEDDTENFPAVMSFARGGLANGWGAGTLCFNDADLDGFPISARDLAPFYRELTQYIGITGEEDDLTRFLGSTEHLLEPIPLSPLSADFIGRYTRNKKFFSQRNLYVGRTRAAILSRDYNGRPKYCCNGHDFFEPNNRAIYHPGYTLDELIREKKIEYCPGHLVVKFVERPDGVDIVTRNLGGDSTDVFRAKKLIIAAGALNSARLVLASRADNETRLPLLENPVSYVPLIIPWRIGKKLEVEAFAGGELLVMYPGGAQSPLPLQASFYNLNGPLRSDLLAEFPLAMKGNLAAARYLLPALAMLQVFYPDSPSSQNYLQLKPDGGLRMLYVPPQRGEFERYLLRTFLRIGYLSLPQLCKYPQSGSSIHYAGGLPMRSIPDAPYQTDRNGKLFGHCNVHIADAAIFPRLPAKNLTFTIMANAMRVAEALNQELSS